jgi:hypothetical protein
MQPVRETLGVTYQAGRARVLADTDQDALAGGPRSRNRVRLHFGEQLLVHPVGGAAQRQLAQRRQLGGREEVLQRALRLLGNVDLALLEALDQIVGGQIDKLDRIGGIEN